MTEVIVKLHSHKFNAQISRKNSQNHLLPLGKFLQFFFLKMLLFCMKIE